jgi:hypothetical protein
MITMKNVSTFTILQFNTIALLLTLSCNGFDESALCPV